MTTDLLHNIPDTQRTAGEGGTTAPLPSPVALRVRHRRVLAWGLGTSLLGLFAVYLYLPGIYSIGTDDAYVDAHIVSVTPKVAAYVSALRVDDNARVKVGDLLLELDPRDFQATVDGAKADLASAQASVANIEAQLREQQANIAQSESTIAGDRATLEFSRQELQRYGSLANTGYGTTQRFQQSEADIGQREAALQRDLAALEASRAHIAVLQTEEAQARAAVDRQQAILTQANLNLSYTKVYAADSGEIANKSVEVGNYVQQGQVVLSIVPDAIYVIANFKETQLANIRPGQAVTISIDASSGLSLHGHVDSIQRGTGSQFALLPPENATGNFVKVVQRIPVKIHFDEPTDILRSVSPGMSVEVRITFKQPASWLVPIINVMRM